MKLEDYRNLFLVLISVSILLVALPGLSVVIPLLGNGDGFSELWILGSEHMAENYPSDVIEGVNYTFYVGVGNHIGSSGYYSVRIKFRNQSEPLPHIQPGENEDDFSKGIPSPLPTLYEYQVFLEDGEDWEGSLNFSFSGFSINGSQCMVDNFWINGFSFPVNKPGFWNEAEDGFYYQIFIELWIYDLESEDFEFHNRFVTTWLNMTDT